MLTSWESRSNVYLCSYIVHWRRFSLNWLLRYAIENLHMKWEAKTFCYVSEECSRRENPGFFLTCSRFVIFTRAKKILQLEVSHLPTFSQFSKTSYWGNYFLRIGIHWIWSKQQTSFTQKISLILSKILCLLILNSM